jgi:hypothetical protein
MISLGQAAGFSLTEIASMLTPGPKPKIDKARLATKVAEIDGLIARLSAMRTGLVHALECQAPDFSSCPHFQRILKAVERHRLPAAPLRDGLLSRRTKG